MVLSPTKPPPSPSLHSATSSILSFPLHPDNPATSVEHRLTPLEEDKIFLQLRNCDPIRYAAYRMAVKIDIVQQALKLNAVKLSVVCNVFQHHGLQENELVLDSHEASEVISDIFYAASKVRSCHSPPMDVEALTSSAFKFAIRIFDSIGFSTGVKDSKESNDKNSINGPKSLGASSDIKSSSGILVKSLKTFFLVLCDGRLREKFAYLFRQFAEGGGNNGFLTRFGLGSMLCSLVQFAEFFGENVSFGRSFVEGSVAQCFSRFSNGDGGITEDDFMRWLLLEPQVIVWLPTHFRLVSAKGVRHGLRCRSCKMEDIIGMRYQCLRCLRYDLCQHCFFYGHSNRHHKLEHPMQEYCHRSSRKDSTKAFLKLLINNIRKRKLSQCKQRYLCPATVLEKSGNGSDESSGFHSEASSDSVDNKPSIDPANNVAFDPAMDHTVVRQEGDLIISRQQQSGHKRGNYSQESVDHRRNVWSQDGCDQVVTSRHQQMFNSIVLHMEEHNNEMLENLKKMDKPQQPLDNCVSMQIQLNKLKSLMDAIFTTKAGNSNATNGSLNDPSVIESTPVVRYGRRSGLLMPMDRDFSPIVRSAIKSPKNGIKTNGTIQQGHWQGTMLHGQSNGTAMLHSMHSSRSEDQTTALPSLTEMSMGDISSLLVKTGKIEAFGDQDLDRLNITEKLVGEQSNNVEEDENAMEEMETLMLRLEGVFQSFHGLQGGALIRNTVDARVGCIVSEIGDQIHNFAYQYRMDHDL